METTSYVDIGALQRPESGGSAGTSAVDIGSAQRQEATGVVISCTPGNAVANGVTATVVTSNTISCTPGNAVANGVAAGINGGINLVDVVDRRVLQRIAGVASLAISGTYTGSPTNIEARVVIDGTSTEALPWTTLAVAPTGGTFSGTLANIPQGGWYNVQVRFSNIHSTSAGGTHKFGVGAQIAIIGQSQMTNWFSVGTGNTPDDLTSYYNGYTGAEWHAFGSAGTGAITFANKLRAALGNIPVGLMAYGWSGAGLVGSGNAFWDDTSSGSPYWFFKAGVVSAGGKLEACVWAQGETDAYNGITEAAYQSALEGMITQIRSDFGQASLPFVILPLAGSTDSRDTDAHHEGIRRAQITVGQESNNTLAAFNQDIPLSDGTHYTPSGYAMHGTRGARAVMAALGLSSYRRGPAIASANLTNSTTIQVNLTHRGGTDITPSSGITGFIVLGGGTPVTISSVVRSSASQITITLSSALTGAGTLKYQWGMNPVVTSPALDNTIETLPIGLESGQTLALSQTISCLVGNALADGIPLVGLPVTISCAPGNAAAGGVTASIVLGIATSTGNAIADGVAATITVGAMTLTTADITAIVSAVLAAAAAAPIAANIKQTNNEEIIGDGSLSNKFRSHLVP